MSKYHWIIYVARRYFRTKRQDKGLTPGILSVAGIMIGVIAILCVLGVMNGFQIGMIDNILAIRSYHIRLSGMREPLDPAVVREISSMRGVKTVLPFTDIQAMINTRYSGFHICLIRGVPVNTPQLDPGLIRQLGIIQGEFDLQGDHALVIGNVLAKNLGIRLGDEVSLVTLAGQSFQRLHPENIGFKVTGIFKSGYYEFDSTLGFIALGETAAISLGKPQLVYGIKLADRFHDQGVLEPLRALGKKQGFEVTSWQEYERGFFGALRMEKLVMTLLLGLIFIVVGVNIFHSLRRTVNERTEEIAVLRSFGSSPGAIKAIFVLEGFFIGFIGSLLGLIVGMLISVNINGIFMFFGIFSPSYFYLDKVVSIVSFNEALYIFLFGVFCAGAAAYFASKRISEIKPAEVLRNE